ncbi:MAG TPA: FAD-dependent oxidoreductase [Steroidobacteraceae bacterium]|nr:FAD-dependent oxidoreductase [Steroidobacteraceae bacterium]
MGDAGAALAQSTHCDIAVIGSGITGALVTDALIATGQDIVMLDARDQALGSTAASTALLQYEIDTHLTDLARSIGEERATRAYHACAASFEMLERRFPELLRPSDYRRRESLYLAADQSAVQPLRAELAARRRIGLACEWLDGDELRQRFGCQRPGAILSALGAELDPMRFTQALICGAERHGVRRFARSKVDTITEHQNGLRLTLGTGLTVDASHVIVAAGYESLEFLPREVADIDNTYAVVTQPLADPRRAATMPLMWESARPYLYLRGTPDGRMIVGGADVPFRNPAARDALLSRQVRRLAAGYRELFGEELPPIDGAWGGSFASTHDGLPFIGRVPGMHPGLQFALCFGGNGITFSVHAAEMIRAGVDGRTHPLDDVFGFGRTVAGLTERLTGALVASNR